MRKGSGGAGILILAFLLLSLACRLSPGTINITLATPTAAAVDEPGVPRPSPTPLPASTEAASSLAATTAVPDGWGNIEGRILWNDAEAAGVAVALCRQLSYLGDGCYGDNESTTADENGSFRFEAVPSGVYYVAVRFDGSDRWLALTGEQTAFPAQYTISPDETLVLAEAHVIRRDLILREPVGGAERTGVRLSLAWQPYERASYYEVYLSPEHGETVYTRFRVEGTELRVDSRLFDCPYAWNVTAFNDRARPLARSDRYGRFVISGRDVPCHIDLVSPAAGTTLKTGYVKLDWDSHPLADRYSILMWNDSLPDRPNVVDFVEVVESEYTLPQRLENGRYVWSISVYDTTGMRVAEMPVTNFIVEE